MTTKSTQDRLTLSGIKLRPRIGVNAGERRFPQACSADITICGDFEAAAATDDLAHALDYTRILERVEEVAHAREYNLIETLAYQVARAVLQAFPAFRVHVKIRKLPAVLAGKIDYVEVEVEQE